MGPGVIFHELSHALACLIMGAKIVKISFFDKDGGSVTHQKPLIPVLGPILISTAPLILGILAFYLLAKQIKLLDSLDLSAMFFNVKSIYQTVDLSNWMNLLIIYLLFSVGVTMTPSRQDLVNMIIPILILSTILFLTLRFTALSLNQYEFIFFRLTPIISIVVFILILCLLVSLFFYIITKFIFNK